MVPLLNDVQYGCDDMKPCSMIIAYKSPISYYDLLNIANIDNLVASRHDRITDVITLVVPRSSTVDTMSALELLGISQLASFDIDDADHSTIFKMASNKSSAMIGDCIDVKAYNKAINRLRSIL